MEPSIFQQILDAIRANTSGANVLRNLVAPLFGDAELIAKFYNDAEASFSEHGDEHARIVFGALDAAKVEIPPVPGTLDDPLALSADGKNYLDPVAAAEMLQGAFASTSEQVPAMFASLPADPLLAGAFLQAQLEIPTADVPVLETSDIVSLSTEQISSL